MEDYYPRRLPPAHLAVRDGEPEEDLPSPLPPQLLLEPQTRLRLPCLQHPREDVVYLPVIHLPQRISGYALGSPVEGGYPRVLIEGHDAALYVLDDVPVQVLELPVVYLLFLELPFEPGGPLREISREIGDGEEREDVRRERRKQTLPGGKR